MSQEFDGASWLAELSSAERTRLVRLCAYLTQQAEAAEDLAQETLYEACRNLHKLDDPANPSRWLAAIARNICLRWVRHYGQDQAHRTPHVRDVPSGMPIEDDVAADINIESDLERAELADLLNRALTLLRPTTRAVLVERYMGEASLAAIAARFSLSEAVVAKRLERGKLTLRRLLTTMLRDEATAYGVSATGWRDTQIWCSGCGRSRLLMHLAQPPGTISFRCPTCSPAQGANSADYLLTNSFFAHLLGGLTQPRAVLKRTSQWSHAYFRHALDDRLTTCTHCARPAHLHITCPEDRALLPGGVPWLVVSCDACGHLVSSSLGGLVASLPQVQHFWREHRRIRTSAWREVEVDGYAAVVASLESVTSAAKLDVVSKRDTLQLVGIYGAHSTAPGC